MLDSVDGAVGEFIGNYVGRSPVCFGEDGVLISLDGQTVAVRYSDIATVEPSRDKSSGDELVLELHDSSRVTLCVDGADETGKYRDVYVVATLLLLVIRGLSGSE